MIPPGLPVNTFLMILLVVAVLIALGAAGLLPKEPRARNGARFWVLYATAAVVWLILIVSLRSGLSTVWTAFNIAIIVAGCIAYVYISVASFAIQSRFVAITLGTLFSAPLFALMLTLPFSLVYGAALANHLKRPWSVMNMPDGLICHSHVAPFTPFGDFAMVQLQRPVMGFLLVRVAHAEHTVTRTETYEPSTDCYALLAQSKPHSR